MWDELIILPRFFIQFLEVLIPCAPTDPKKGIVMKLINQKIFMPLIIVLLSINTFLAAQTKSSTNLPDIVWGTWEIYKYYEVGGHAGEKPEKAKNEFGKIIKFSKGAIDYSKKFLFFDPPCQKISYSIKVINSEEFAPDEKSTLRYYGLSSAWENQTKYIIVECNSAPQYFFEITKDNQLAIYYDGWFFFLKNK
jgi:hypothetical protein